MARNYPTPKQERKQIDKEWLLERLAAEATADVNDLYDEDGYLLPVAEWPLIWRQGLIADIEIKPEIDANGVTIGNVTKIKQSDRKARLEMIGKHVDVQAFREQRAVTGADGGPIELVELSDVEREQRLVKALRGSSGGS